MIRSIPGSRAVLLLAFGLVTGCALEGDRSSGATDASFVEAPVGPVFAGTHFLDHAARLGAAGINDQGWFEANIPFLDIPDAEMQNVYY